MSKGLKFNHTKIGHYTMSFCNYTRLYFEFCLLENTDARVCHFSASLKLRTHPYRSIFQRISHHIHHLEGRRYPGEIIVLPK